MAFINCFSACRTLSYFSNEESSIDQHDKAQGLARSDPPADEQLRVVQEVERQLSDNERSSKSVRDVVTKLEAGQQRDEVEAAAQRKSVPLVQKQFGQS